MIIKSSKKLLYVYLVSWFLLSLVPFMFLLSFGDWPQVAATVAVLLHFIMARDMLISFRTIEMDENGCTVSLLFFKKRYLWNELKTKHMEDYRDRLIKGNPSGIYRGVVFSKKKNFRVPRIMHISVYWLICINPFNFFVVFFKPPEGFFSGGFYEVDEDVFMSKMEEYGVTITK